jgi:hypothetical protein
MMQPMKLRGWLPLLLLSVTLPAEAQEKTLAGRWSASTSRASWTIDQWGDACGPRPVGESVPGGVVTIAMRGNELSISGLGRNYSSNTCWETIPGQRVTGHSATGRAWRTTCQSPAGDSRRSTVTTTLSATDERIDFTEVGQFEFTIEGQTCRAAMRRNRTYSLVEREGESRSVPEQPAPAQPLALASSPEEGTRPPPTSDQKVEERTSANCASVGPPARLEVRPSRKLLRAGDQYTFHVQVLDRAGCGLQRALTWKVVDATTTLEVAPTGLIQVPKDAAEGSATLAASVQDRSVQVFVDVVSESRYQDLLAAGKFDDRGETRDSAVVTMASADVGTRAAVLQEKARSRRLIFVGVVGLFALGLAGAALWMAFGRRRHKQQYDSTIDSGIAGAGAAGETLVCPTCQGEYPANTRFCAVDGNRLVPMPPMGQLEGGEGGVCPVCGQGFDPGVTSCPTHDEELVPPMALGARQANPRPPTRRICPICGTIYGTEHQFCGNDGAALVQIN